MQNINLKEGGTFSTIFSVSRFVIKKQWQFVVLSAIFLRAVSMGFKWGLVQVVGPETSQEIQSAMNGTSSSQIQNFDWAGLLPSLPLLALGGVVLAVVYLLTYMTVILKIFQTVESNEQSLEATIHQARRKLWKYIWTSILQGICLLGLFILLIIPGIIFMIYRYFALYTVLYHNKSGMAALDESKAIVKHRRRKTLGYMLLVGIVVGLVIALFLGVVGAIVGTVTTDAGIIDGITQLFSTITQLLILVIIAVFFLRWDKTRIIQIVSQS